MADFYQFSWTGTVAGYRWVTDADGRRVLTDGLGLKEPRESFQYSPLKHTGLFKTFAATEISEAGIRAFANKYGQIADNKPIGKTEPGVPPDALGQPYITWKKSIIQMRNAIDLWCAARDEDLDYLGRVIEWSDKGPVCSLVPDINLWRFLNRFQRGDLVGPAWYFVQDDVNTHLKGVSPRLLWDRDGKEISLHDTPDSLLTAMWLQFAQAIAGNKHYQRCITCGSFFELAPSVNRKDRVYCTAACRSAAYRKRRASK